jgi:phosphoglycerate dehydrogenase-like enzyme
MAFYYFHFAEVVHAARPRAPSGIKPTLEQSMKVAILDDYQSVALKMADWSDLQRRCTIDVINRPFTDENDAARVLAPYDIVCTLRERTAFPRSLIAQLPNLKLIVITGLAHRTLDLVAATEHGIMVCNSTSLAKDHQATKELAFGLMLALGRHIPFENRRIREGHWQSTVGIQLHGRTLGLLGLGKIGKWVASTAQAFGMTVIAWSQNLTEAAATEVGVRRVDKDELFRLSDIVSLHVVLGERTRGIVGAREFSLMKKTAYIINTARGPLIDEAALIDALQNRRIAGAGLDVYWNEPVPADHPLLALDNVVLTPHLGYVSEEAYVAFYGDTVEAMTAYLAGKPIRVVNGVGQDGRATQPHAATAAL